MPLSLEQFWSLAARSLIFEPGELSALRQRFDHAVADDTKGSGRAAAEWLVKQHKLTVYQAKTLLSGQPGPFQFGEYRILQPRLVPGDAGSRWKALHVGTNHRVLLHIWPESAEELWPLAREQAEAATRIRHPNLDRVYTSVVTTDCRMAVSEAPEGDSLRELLQRRQRLPVPQACWLVQQMAAGLCHLHALGAVHGRLSADEAVVQSGGHVKLLRVPWAPASFEVTGVSGLPSAEACQCRAPEFLQPGTSPDTLTDVYALGCLFYQLIAGRPPFTSLSADQIMADHSGRRIEPLEQFATVPAGLGELVSFMMAKRRQLRMSDMTDVVDQLNDFVPRGVRQTTPRARATESYYLAHLQQINAPPVAAADEPPVVIDVKSRPNLAGRATVRSAIRRPRAWQWPAIGLALLSLMLVIVALRPWARRGGAKETTANSSTTARSDAIVSTIDAPPSDVRPEETMQPTVNLVEDDGRTLWASPTSGPPIDLGYMPSGAQMFIHARPARLAAAPEGTAILKALGPDFASMRARFESLWQLSITDIDQLLIAFQPQDVGMPVIAYRLHISAEVRDYIVAEGSQPQTRRAGQVVVRGDVAAFFPHSQRNMIVVGPPKWIDILADRNANSRSAPTLRRQLETLRLASDVDRHFSVLVAPNFLAADGRALWVGPHERLRESFLQVLGDSTQAASVSIHFGDGTYAELRLIGSVDQNPLAVAMERLERLARLPEQVTRYLEQVPLERYWQRLAIRFPQMLQFLTQQLRAGHDDATAVLNAVLPPGAAHNLILAGELALANAPLEPTPHQAAGSAPLGIEAILGEPIGIQVDQQSLDMVVQELTEVVRAQTGNREFSIHLVGADLELEGITQNQQIRDLRLAPQPLRRTLTDLVVRANPVAVDDPRSAKQRLIWVVSPDQSATILLTTRSAAEEKRLSLPKEFIAEAAPVGLE